MVYAAVTHEPMKPASAPELSLGRDGGYMPLKYNLTFALITYWWTGDEFWLGELKDETQWANYHLKMPVFEDWCHPFVELEAGDVTE